LHYVGFFFGDVLSAWLLVKPLDDVEKQRVDRAAERLVEIYTNPLYKNALGDSLTDPMFAIYRDQQAMVRFARRGGLVPLFNDWADSIAKDTACHSAIADLLPEAWENQTEASLFGIMRALRYKVAVESDETVVSPVFARVLHEIFSRYKLSPFEKASQIHDENDTILFNFLYKRLSRKPSAFRTLEGMQGLLQKYTHIPKIVRSRYVWLTLPLSGKWNALEDARYGCCRPECPEKKALLNLKQRRKRGVRNPEVEDRLTTWGEQSKFCKRCWTVTYCSVECQRAHWERHRPDCKEKDPQEKNEMIVQF